jgi:hypothetical protein
MVSEEALVGEQAAQNPQDAEYEVDEQPPAGPGQLDVAAIDVSKA